MNDSLSAAVDALLKHHGPRPTQPVWWWPKAANTIQPADGEPITAKPTAPGAEATFGGTAQARAEDAGTCRL